MLALLEQAKATRDAYWAAVDAAEESLREPLKDFFMALGIIRIEPGICGCDDGGPELTLTWAPDRGIPDPSTFHGGAWTLLETPELIGQLQEAYEPDDVPEVLREATEALGGLALDQVQEFLNEHSLQVVLEGETLELREHHLP